MHKLTLSLIVILGLILRIIWIDKYPIGFTQDEAGLGYEAYSLLLTGKDQWGMVTPLTFRSFGDFKLPMYVYLTVPSVALFGLNEWSVRLPSAVFGTLSILFTYLMVEAVTKHKDLAIWSALLLAVSPWHISLSRGAFEANLTSSFLPFAVWMFYKGLEKNKFLLLSGVVFGLNLFTYHSARIFTPIIFAAILLLNRQRLRNIFNLKASRGYLTFSTLVFSLFFLTTVYTMFTGAGKRATDVVIFNPTDQWASMANRRFETISQGVSPQIARFFSNKPKYIFSQFTNNYLSYLSPEFLFVRGAGEWSYGMVSGRGVLYLFEIAFLLFGILFSIRKKESGGMEIFILWILLSPLPAAISKAPGFSATRAAVMMPAIQIMTAYGIVASINYLAQKIGKMYLRLFKYAFLLILFLSTTFFLEDYLYHAPAKAAGEMRYGRREAMGFVSQIEDQYDGIFISRSLGVPQVWVQFYTKYDPIKSQIASKDWLMYERLGYGYLDQLDGYQLGKYTFGSIYPEKIKNNGEILVVGSPGEISESITPFKTVYYPDGKPAVQFYNSSQL